MKLDNLNEPLNPVTEQEYEDACDKLKQLLFTDGAGPPRDDLSPEEEAEVDRLFEILTEYELSVGDIP